MVNFRIGTAGFSYDDWIGSFYPSHISKDRFLDHYSKFFDIVEINSSHYNIPKSTMLKKWASTAEKFKFCMKIWNQVTHVKDYGLGLENLQLFLHAMTPLSPKIAYYLLQFPPYFKKSDENVRYLKSLLSTFEVDVKVAVELRDNSWFNSEILHSFLNGSNHILGTVYLNDITPYYPKWQKSYYIRVIGDRTLTKFNEVQREIPKIWSDLTLMLETIKDRTDIVDIIVIFNNHYSGFSPTDSNRLKQFLGLPLKDFNKRTSITDFF